MLRGAQKQMIVVRTHGNRVFEEAYFVIRREAVRADADESDMIREANRIIESSLPPTVPTPPREIPPTPRVGFNLAAGLVWFGLGLLTGGGLVGLLWWLL